MQKCNGSQELVVKLPANAKARLIIQIMRGQDQDVQFKATSICQTYESIFCFDTLLHDVILLLVYIFRFVYVTICRFC